MFGMRLLVILLVFCLGAIFWACYGFARHVKRHREQAEAAAAAAEQRLLER